MSFLKLMLKMPSLFSKHDESLEWKKLLQHESLFVPDANSLLNAMSMDSCVKHFLLCLDSLCIFKSKTYILLKLTFLFHLLIILVQI